MENVLFGSELSTAISALGTGLVTLISVSINSYIREKKDAVQKEKDEKLYQATVETDERGIEKAVRYSKIIWKKEKDKPESKYADEMEVTIEYIKAVNRPLYERYEEEALKFMILRVAE